MLSSNQPIAMHRDENAMSNGGASTAKTPAASKARRAFGDISNRKLGGNNATTNKAKTPGAVLFKTTSKAPLQQPSANKKAAPLESTSKPLNHQSTKRVEFILPDSGAQAKEHSKPKTIVETSKPKTVDTEIYPEIERPAGRLWSQQRAEVDLFNGDVDDGSRYYADLSFEGADTIREDHAKCLRGRMQALIDYDLENEERCLQELYATSKRVVESDGACVSVCVHESQSSSEFNSHHLFSFRF